MSKSANKTIIGAFVIGALSLLVVAIAAFGSGKFFETSYTCVLLFDSSISGLSVGSPVMFRGVPVGRVKDIRLVGNLQTMRFQTPVFIELDPKRSPELAEDESIDKYLSELITHGLRATLATQSLVTGQLMIELNIYPPSQVDRIVVTLNEYEGYPEIPTMPSKLDNVVKKFSSLPVDQIAENLLEITDNLANITRSTDTAQIVAHMNNLLIQLQTVSASVDKTLASVQGLSESYKHLAQNADLQLTKTLEEASSTLKTIAAAGRNAEEVMAGLKSITAKNSPTILDLNKTLREIAEAARALRILSNTLERNPEALLRGKTR